MPANSSTRICHWCHNDLSDRTITISETDDDTTAINDWLVCSWACADQLVTRFLRSNRSDG